MIRRKKRSRGHKEIEKGDEQGVRRRDSYKWIEWAIAVFPICH